VRLRHDAALVAAQVAVAVRELVVATGARAVGTVGRLRVHPDLVNVVASSATMTVDLRNTDEAVLQEAESRLRAFVADAAAAEGVDVACRSLARFEPVAFDEGVQGRIEETARRHGRSTMRMPSGAGHDAQMFARVCPTGMIFVPSHRGISHNPAEYTPPAALAAGADVLLEVMMELAR
jgi:N-carbamoyl-L-amino-acid hydrolase